MGFSIMSQSKTYKGYQVEKINDFDWYIETKLCGKMGPYPTRKLAVEHAQELDA